MESGRYPSKTLRLEGRREKDKTGQEREREEREELKVHRKRLDPWPSYHYVMESGTEANTPALWSLQRTKNGVVGELMRGT